CDHIDSRLLYFFITLHITYRFCFFCRLPLFLFSFFFNAPAPTEIYTLSLHDALPICRTSSARSPARCGSTPSRARSIRPTRARRDRKSTRLNSSHLGISYAVFCLKKKKKKKQKK